MATAYIGLGSNLPGQLLGSLPDQSGKTVNPTGQVKQALKALSQLPETVFLQHSSLYCSKPLALDNSPAQPDYINAVAAIDTRLKAEKLLDALQRIEADHKRVRDKKWGPRTLDLDLLLYDNTVINTPRLQVPHPGLPERAFVLYPLAEIAPLLDIPGQGLLSQLLLRCPRGDLRMIEQA